MPGLKFLLRLIPICVGLVGTVAVVYVLLFLAMKVSQHLFNFGGETIRDYIRWLFTPRNFIVLGPLVVALCLVLAFLALSRYF